MAQTQSSPTSTAHGGVVGGRSQDGWRHLGDDQRSLGRWIHRRRWKADGNEQRHWHCRPRWCCGKNCDRGGARAPEAWGILSHGLSRWMHDFQLDGAGWAGWGFMVPPELVMVRTTQFIGWEAILPHWSQSAGPHFPYLLLPLLWTHTPGQTHDGATLLGLGPALSSSPLALGDTSQWVVVLCL